MNTPHMWHKPCKLRPHHTLLTEKPLPTNSLKSEPWMPKANTRSNSMTWRLSINSSSYAHSISFTKRCFQPSCQDGFTSSRRSFAILRCIHTISHQPPFHQLELKHQGMSLLQQDFIETQTVFKRALLRELWAP